MLAGERAKTRSLLLVQMQNILSRFAPLDFLNFVFFMALTMLNSLLYPYFSMTDTFINALYIFLEFVQRE